MRRPTILICDDDSLFHLSAKSSLKARFECRSAYNTDEALAIVRNHPIDLVLLDVQMRTPDEGLRALPALRELDPELSIIMSSGVTDLRTIIEAIRLGAFDYVAKDFGPEELLLRVDRALEHRELRKKTRTAGYEAATLQQKHLLIGESPAIQNIRRVIERVRESSANVLITGESGTGKEVVARHLRKTLPDGSLEPFVAVDSSTIHGGTAESFLFGHEKGAFTGATGSRRGVFEEADGGVLYFDEIGNLPLEIQPKLLRAIQEQEIVRLGSTKVVTLSFRVVCASHVDLEALSREGRFKPDLLQRLNVLPIGLPPLRDRLEDLPLLVNHFLSCLPGTAGSLRFTEEALSLLKSHSWPGNIRELASVVSYVAAMTEGTEVDIIDLPPRFRELRRPKAAANPPTTPGADYYEQVAGFERDLLTREYAATGGNISRLALQLCMDRSHLYTKLREFGLHPSKKV